MEPSFARWQPKKDRSQQMAVLMSGGVDSSVTAHLLREQGFEVLGVTMKIPVSCGTNVRGCCGADAAFVCNELNIPHYFVDVTRDFEELIIGRARPPTLASTATHFLSFRCCGTSWLRLSESRLLPRVTMREFPELASDRISEGQKTGRKTKAIFYMVLPQINLPDLFCRWEN